MDDSKNIIQMYSEFDIQEKRKLLSDEISELVLIIKKMKGDLELPDDDPENSILKKLYSNDNSEDEYMVSLYENIFALKEELGEYLSVIVDSLYE